MALARERDRTFLSAGVVYYAFTSIPPLVLPALVVGTVVGGDGPSRCWWRTRRGRCRARARRSSRGF